MQNGLAEARNGRECCCEINFLESAWAEDLCIHLSCQSKDRRAVDFGIPKAGHQVGGARTSDGQTRGGLPGQFGVTGAGEGGSTLVTNTIIIQPSLFLLQPERIGQAKVGMTDHAEHGGHTPVGHGLRHDIGDCCLMGRFGFQPNIDSVFAFLNRIQSLAGVLVATRWTPGFRIKVPTMPWTAQPALSVFAGFDGTFTQWPTLVRTAIIHSGIFAIDQG